MPFSKTKARRTNPKVGITRAMNRIPPIIARRRSKTDRFFAIVGRWAKLVQSLTIIFGVVVGVISIIDGQLEKRLTRTLDFNKDYNENIRSDFIDLATQFNGLVESKGGFPQGDDERKAVVLSFF